MPTLSERHRALWNATPSAWALARHEREPWLAARIGFRNPSRHPTLFDHDIPGVNLDSRLDVRLLMPWEYDEPARMGPHASVFRDLEVQYPAAVHANALAYEGIRRLAVAWTLILDPIVYATCQGLVLGQAPLALIIHSVIIPLGQGGRYPRRRSARMGSAAITARPFVDRQRLVLAAVARVRVERTCLRVPIAGRFSQMLSLDRLSLCGGTSLPRLSGAFLGFSLSTLGFGGLLISRGARTFSLDRTASGLLAKLASLLATTFVTPATRGADDESDEQ